METVDLLAEAVAERDAALRAANTVVEIAEQFARAATTFNRDAMRGAIAGYKKHAANGEPRA